MIYSKFLYIWNKTRSKLFHEFPQNKFILYSSFSVRFTENFHEQKKNPRKMIFMFDYNIFLENV